ncbi:D-ribose pyranase [Chimaeribacter arupi]|uniref:D-ribose pyranase n=1 Tax=Chimaeribacter arupi TaxID=2060066 RepID=A0A2N5ELL3_9GAMM|nr:MULTISPECIES: D-ribose pyranase [Yersiniaceae]MDV5142449.1 D-ribose pyranase [Chimaeribacter arupi]PLR37075.1 D-ribose pyranase [Chimaeribacter arupi]PLR45628.1 D-ribose pyranase [Chimaeribacter arupi]PLR48079.1 D-ribose pyranase [Chimaeribacter arupi]PLR54668.1 D-ribose pyranase [Chimaeribacter arupi]
MKKAALLNAELSYVIAKLGHTDQLVIADAGLPVPATTQRIDLALTHGIPGFMPVLDVVTQEMQVERVLLAEELKTHNPAIHQQLCGHLAQLEARQGNTIEVTYLPHAAFKTQSAQSRAIVRTGECSPYANIILCAGVTF